MTMSLKIGGLWIVAAMMVLVSASSRPAGNVHDIRVIKNGGNWKMRLVFVSYLLFLFKEITK